MVTFSSGTPSSATISRFEHSDNVMIACESLAHPLKKMRCVTVILLDRVGMVIGVTSWIVQTAGTRPTGSVAAVGIKITSAWERAAEKPAPPNLQTRLES